MPEKTREVRPSPRALSVVSAEGIILQIPTAWSLLSPGDAALSGRVKKEGPCWIVKEKHGRRMISKGIWAPAERIERIRAQLLVERNEPAYERKLSQGRARRAKEQVVYADDFEASVLTFLRFASRSVDLARKMARAISDHAVPVGSGTVARTKRIPIERRAEAAAIAWMRHQTTAYDNMLIPREKGRRREVRRMLAERSRSLLNQYRNELGKLPENCPLYLALRDESAEVRPIQKQAREHQK